MKEQLIEKYTLVKESIRIEVQTLNKTLKQGSFLPSMLAWFFYLELCATLLYLLIMGITYEAGLDGMGSVLMKGIVNCMLYFAGANYLHRLETKVTHLEMKKASREELNNTINNIEEK